MATKRGSIAAGYMNAYNPKPPAMPVQPSQATPPSLPNIVARTLDALAPYDRLSFPGKWNLWRLSAPGYTLSAIQKWRYGYRKASIAVHQHWAELLEAQAAVLLALAAENRAVTHAKHKWPDAKERMARARSYKRKRFTT